MFQDADFKQCDWCDAALTPETGAHVVDDFIFCGDMCQWLFFEAFPGLWEKMMEEA